MGAGAGSIRRVDRSELSALAHRHHPIAAPVSAVNLATLVGRLVPVEGASVLDLGCGHGQWLLEVLAQHRTAAGVGVDLHLPAEVGAGAARQGLEDRVTWREQDARTWAGEPADVVLCIGASHAFGGLDRTLAACRRHLRPGGQVLLGDGFWEAPPSPLAQEVLDARPEDLPDLAGFLQRVARHGFEPGYGHVSSPEEWDDYEWSWTGSLAAWALHAAPSEEARQQALPVAREHRDGWVAGYRGELGFVTAVLHDTRRAAVRPR